MSDPAPTPPARQKPRVNWWRAALLAVGLAYLGCMLVFPRDSFAFAHLAVLSLAPFALLVLTWRKWCGPVGESAEAGWLRFHRFWTWVWLVAALASTALFAFGKGWQGDSVTALRLSLALLLLWTSLLLLAMRGIFRALGWRAFWRVAVRKSAFAAALLATLVALFYAEENWRGRRAWERFRADWEAKGVKFTIAEVMPPPVRDEENIAFHRLFKPLFEYTKSEAGHAVWRDEKAVRRLQSLTIYPLDLRQVAQSPFPWPGTSGAQNRTNGVVLADFAAWQRFYRHDTNFAATTPSASAAADVLRYLQRHDALLGELAEALNRPQWRFPWPLTSELPYDVLMPHLANLKQTATLLNLRASAMLEVGQPDAALQDMEQAWQLCQTFEREPVLISQLVQISVQAITMGTVAHGCAQHRWEDRHLQRIEAMLRPVNKLRNWELSVHGEAALLTDFMSKLRLDRVMAEKEVTKWEDLSANAPEDLLRGHPAVRRVVMRYGPDGWFHFMLRHELANLLTKRIPAYMDTEARRVHWQSRPGSQPKPWFHSLWPFLSSEEGFVKAAAKAARLQTNFDHARLAIALERHWLRHRAYPERLDALVPEFLDRLPHDLFDGQPMRYRREGGQGFVLWSIGFDGKDDNAGPLLTKPSGTTQVGEETGDLVWRYPQSP
ncbi:MAG: hypothetical protein ABMA26_26440 [Limisphaerales bacterium]